MEQQVKLPPKSRENPLINLLANVVLPVLILKKFSKFGPGYALLIALCLPLGYGLWSYSRDKKINYISLLGLINTLFTGGFAFLKLEGIWFAVKEAGFPLIIGCFVLLSSYKKKPFLGMMLLDTGVLNTDEIYPALEARQNKEGFLKLMQSSTFFFSLTFFLSAVLNFVLAYGIFTKIPEGLDEVMKSELLNDQIARMTWMGYLVIFIPSIVLFFIIMFFFFKRLTQLTGIKFEELVKS